MGDIIITWKQFLEVVSTRFEDLSVSNIIVEFNKLRMIGSFEDYVERFDELRSCLLMEDDSRFSEEYFIASFLSGLGEDLRSFIKMFHPQTLDQAIDLGKQQLLTLEAIAKKMRSHPRSFASHSAGFRRPESAPISIPVSPKSSVPSPQKHTPKLLTSAEMAARREKGLCYNCDEKYFLGQM